MTVPSIIMSPALEVKVVGINLLEGTGGNTERVMECAMQGSLQSEKFPNGMYVNQQK